MSRFSSGLVVRALEAWQQVEGFIFTKHEDGLISHAEMDELMLLQAKTLTEAGGDGRKRDPSFGPVLLQATHLVRQALLKQHPEMENELRNHMKGFER